MNTYIYIYTHTIYIYIYSTNHASATWGCAAPGPPGRTVVITLMLLYVCGDYYRSCNN